MLKEDVQQFIHDESLNAISMVSDLADAKEAYDEMRHASMAIGHTCPKCARYFDLDIKLKKAVARVEAAKSFLKVL